MTGDQKRLGWVLGLSALAVAAACKGTEPLPADDLDGFSDDSTPSTGFVSVAVSVGSGTASFQCPGNPDEVHATLSLNGALLRDDAKVGAEIGEDLSVEGVLAAGDDSTFTVDACSLVTCETPELYEVTLDVGIVGVLLPPDGAFVRLRWLAKEDGSFAVVLENRAELQGMVNPIDEKDHLWFQVMQGFVPTAPFLASFSLADKCFTTNGNIFARDMYVVSAEDPEEQLQISMGATMPWTITEGVNQGSWDVTNLASYASGEVPVSAMIVARH